MVTMNVTITITIKLMTKTMLTTMVMTMVMTMAMTMMMTMVMTMVVTIMMTTLVTANLEFERPRDHGCTWNVTPPPRQRVVTKLTSCDPAPATQQKVKLQLHHFELR